MSAHRRLSEFVKPAEASGLQREWEQVQRRVRRRRIQRVAVPLVTLVLAGVVAGAFTWRARQPELLEPGLLAEATTDARVARLPDGSQVSIAAGSALRLERSNEEEVLVFVERGSADFTVAKRKVGRFTVRAGDVDVRVVGTVFRVLRAAELVTVDVQEGVVEVRQGEQVVRLARDQHWVSQAPAPQVVPVDVEPLPAQPEDGETHERRDDDEPLPSSPGRPQRRKSSKRPQAALEKPEPSTEVVETKPDAGAVEEPTPADVFRDAMRDRNQGEVRLAMGGFQLVCERWPSSAFAPMSAFEWGRLAIDVEHDPRLAARAFERALELARAPSLVEDTLARLAEAYSRFDVPACQRVSTEYLRRFPQGPHVVGVKKACPAAE